MMKQYLIVLATCLLGIQAYGQQYGTFKDARDGRVYKTVKIGNQIWMAENLNAHKFLNGDEIPFIHSDTAWYDAGNMRLAGKCFYQNDQISNQINGLLYNGFAINDERKLAPEGWHIPSNDEWEVLKKNLYDTAKYKIFFEADKLQDQLFPIHYECIFFVRAAGSRSYGTPGYGSKFSGINQHGAWWSSSSIKDECSLWSLRVNDKNFINTQQFKGLGLSVRCIKD